MNTYIPGVCNIGPAEIARRQRIGWAGLVATILLWILLALMDVSAYWKLLLTLPAAASATGFLQAYFHFCAGFGTRGLFNFGTNVGTTETVQQDEFRKKDRAKAIRIYAYSLGIGIVVALVAYSV